LQKFILMKIVEQIAKKLKKIPRGQVFTYTDFDIDVEKKNTIVKTLNIFADKGMIVRLSKGKYYKPKKSEFGNLQPSSYEIVKDFIEKNGRLIGYITGYSIYNHLLLTTQISNEIQIGTNQYRRAKKRGIYKISFILQPNPITRNNYRLLQILDSVRFVRDIPAMTTDEAIQRLIQIFSELTTEEQEKITKLALKYTDYVRALTAAILDNNNAEKSLFEMLDKSLNGVSLYKLGISETVLPTKTKWRII